MFEFCISLVDLLTFSQHLEHDRQRPREEPDRRCTRRSHLACRQKWRKVQGWAVPPVPFYSMLKFCRVGCGGDTRGSWLRGSRCGQVLPMRPCSTEYREITVKDETSIRTIMAAKYRKINRGGDSI